MGLNLPAVPLTPPPRSIILLTTATSAVDVTKPKLAALTDDGRCSVFAAAVDFLPSPGTARGTGYSWLITSEQLEISYSSVSSSLSFLFEPEPVRIPLATTLFETGTENTLQYLPATSPVGISPAPSVYESGSSRAQLDVKDLKTQPGELGSRVGRRSGTYTDPLTTFISSPSFPLLSPSIPLRALTDPRRVHAAVGNILKLLSDDNGVPIPASEELEVAVVNPVLNFGGVDVFARITPYLPNPQEGILSRDARLHRVLSGGGGWGTKVGLLALDPQTECADSPSGFQPVVRVGEYVQFYTAVGVSFKPMRPGILFGCVPQATEVDGGQRDEINLPGVFGGMTEKGLWVGDRLMNVPFGKLEGLWSCGAHHSSSALEGSSQK